MRLPVAQTLTVLLAIAPLAICQEKTPTPQKPKPQWVERSDQNTKVLLDFDAKFNPESASASGNESSDAMISDFTPGFEDRQRAGLQEAIAELKKREAAETDPLVKQDIQILLTAADNDLVGSDLERKTFVPYVSLSEMLFFATRSLLDDQIGANRRQAALVRLKKYTGMENGSQPVSMLLMQLMDERLKDASLLGPYKEKVEKDLAQSNFFVNGIGDLFRKFKIAGYEPAYEQLKQQVTAYNSFVREKVLPRASTDYRLPPAIYAHNLRRLGVDIPPNELASMAHGSFAEIQNHMQTIAAEIAKERNLPSADYRDVIRELKKQQIVGEAILPHYQQRLKQIEEIVRREHLLTLPAREARIRLATAAESAATPAPNMHPPRMVGNTGEMGEFVLPLNIPSAEGKTQKFDDFTFDAASWTLTAHEARPGHELQFASMLEHGVSNARVLYAFNSTNVEGWGLYAEYILFPYMPAEGKLISLQHRLMRAARAFLDPELQSGKVTPQQAKDILTQDVVLSDAMANQEVERYTSRSPGQATSYFYGYTRLVQLRKDAQKAMGSRFSPQQFHDFVLAQGLLPPQLMRKAVMEQFVGQKATASN